MKTLRLYLFFLVGLLLGANVVLAHAAFSRSTNPSFKASPTGPAWTGAGSVSGGAAQTIETVNVGGKYIGVPTVGALGAAALEVAILGLKATPASLLTSAVITYLGSKGLQWINDKWMKQGDPVPVVGRYRINEFGVTGSSAAQVCDAAATAKGPGYYVDSVSGGTCLLKNPAYPYGQWSYSIFDMTADSCPANYTLSAGACFPNDYVPAGDSDWDRVRGVQAPDAVMDDLCKRLAALGSACTVGGITQSPVTAPLSDWYTDPVTGQQVRQVAKITPASTPEDPTRVAVNTETETKTPATTDPVTGVTTPEKTENKPNQNEDFCVLHPEALACWEKGDAPDSDLQTDQRNISLTPDSGWGASGATCPADLIHTTRAGVQVKMSWQPLCQMANTFRPIVVGMAWLSAIIIFLGISRRAT